MRVNNTPASLKEPKGPDAIACTAHQNVFCGDTANGDTVENTRGMLREAVNVQRPLRHLRELRHVLLYFEVEV